MKQETKKWFEQAERDLQSAENSLRSKDYYISAFLSQQAVEKALKAVIIEKENKLVKIHDLVRLGRNVKLPDKLLLKCEKLSGVYVDSRYGLLEDEAPHKKFNEKDALEFISITKEILKWLKKKI
jgi:HEPN domain-containing protein